MSEKKEESKKPISKAILIILLERDLKLKAMSIQEIQKRYNVSNRTAFNYIYTLSRIYTLRRDEWKYYIHKDEIAKNPRELELESF